MRFAVPSLLLIAALLAGCGADAPQTASAPAPAAPAPATPAEATPAPAPATTDAAAADATPTPTPTPAPESAAVDTATPATDPAAADAATVPAATATPAPPTTVAAPTGPEPREGTDYTIIDPPVLLSPSPGKIEVVEVFAYTCPHCASLQPKMTAWEATLPADVEFRYAPMAHGVSEPIARAFYAAEAMGERQRTHDALFEAIAVKRRLKSGSAEEMADLYAESGVDRDALLATMKSFAVNAQVARTKKAIERWAIEATPTLIVNGRYKVSVTQDRGHEGLISAVDHLIARERAARAGTSATP